MTEPAAMAAPTADGRPANGVRPLLWLLGEQAVSSAGMLLAGILLARSVGPDAYGHYLMAASLLLVTLGFQRALLLTPYVVVRRGFSSRPSAYLAANYGLNAGFALLAAAALAAFAALNPEGILGDDSIAWFWIAAAAAGQSFFWFGKQTLIAHQRAPAAFALGAAGTFTLICLFALATAGGRLTPNAALALAAGALGASGAAALTTLWPRGSSTRGMAKEVAAAHWRFGRWIAASNLLYAVYADFFVWYLAYAVSPAAAARFGVCAILARIIAPVIAGLTNYLYPRLAARADESAWLRTEVVKSLAWLVPVGLALVLVVVPVRDHLTQWIYGDAYDGLGAVLMTTVLALAVTLFNTPLDAAMNARAQTRENFGILGLSAVVGVLAGVVLVPQWMELGAAMAFLAATVVGTAARAWFVLYFPRGER